MATAPAASTEVRGIELQTNVREDSTITEKVPTREADTNRGLVSKMSNSPSRHFHPGQGPSRGLLRDYESSVEPLMIICLCHHDHESVRS